MRVVDLPVGSLREAAWNPNAMEPPMVARLRMSIARFGLVGNLVVRRVDVDRYEVIGGNQRLQMLKEMGVKQVPCVVLDLDDAEARLLAQALNHVEGVDNAGLKAELVKEVLKSIPRSEVLAVLPETEDGLSVLESLGEADLAEHLRAWEQAQAARLRHFTAQLSASQLEVVEEAMERAASGTGADPSNPNQGGNALYHLCQEYLERSPTP